jgi:DNA polymerase I-like protein with 3'-5' exonuclease and polymerase domains
MPRTTRLDIPAPFIVDKNVLIGYAVSPEEGYCAIVPINEFISTYNYIYFQVNAPRIFHGLKRIWEFLDDRGLHMDTDAHRNKDININNIDDTRLLAYLLNPDSARPEADDNDEKLREERLTLAHLASRYLGEDYPYRNTEIHKDKSIEAFADILAHDALLIYRLAAELPSRMSKELDTVLKGYYASSLHRAANEPYAVVDPLTARQIGSPCSRSWAR